MASPHSPNSGSSSRCQPTHDRHPRKRLRFAAVGTSSSAHHGFIRGAMALHTPGSIGQHRSPVRGLMAGPRPYAYEQVHEEPQGTDHTVCYDHFFSQSPAASREEKDSLLGGHQGTTIHQTDLFSPTVTNPTCSEQLCLAQVTQESYQDMKNKPL